MPCVIELRRRLVARHRQGDDEHAELGFGEVAVGLGVDQSRDDVFAGLVGLPRRQLHGVPDQLGRRPQRVVSANSGSSPPIIWLVQSNSLSRSSSGTPSSSAMASSGSSRATCRTKSPDAFGGRLRSDALRLLVELGA